MKFRHESRIESIKQLEKELKKKKAKLLSLPETELIVWEVGQEFEDNHLISSVAWSSNHSISIYINGSISAYVFENLLDELDEIIEPYNYHLMLKESKFNSWQNKYVFYYCKNEKDINKNAWKLKTPYIFFSFAGNQCKQINTGKMIPETKEVCTMIN